MLLERYNNQWLKPIRAYLANPTESDEHFIANIPRSQLQANYFKALFLREFNARCENKLDIKINHARLGTALEFMLDVHTSVSRYQIDPDAYSAAMVETDKALVATYMQMNTSQQRMRDEIARPLIIFYLLDASDQSQATGMNMLNQYLLACIEKLDVSEYHQNLAKMQRLLFRHVPHIYHGIFIDGMVSPSNIALLDQKIMLQAQQIAHLRGQLVSMHQVSQGVVAQNVRLKESTAAGKDALADGVKQRTQQLQSQVDMLQAEVLKMLEEGKKKEKAIIGLAAEKKRLKKKNVQAERQITELSADVIRLRARLREKDEYAETFKIAVIADLEKEVARLTGFEEDNKHLTAELQRQAQQIVDLQKTNSEGKKTHRTALEKDNNRLTAKVSKLDATIKIMKMATDTKAADEISQLRDQIATATTQYESAREKLEKRESDVTRLMKELVTKNRLHTALKRKVEVIAAQELGDDVDRVKAELVIDDLYEEFLVNYTQWQGPNRKVSLAQRETIFAAVVERTKTFLKHNDIFTLVMAQLAEKFDPQKKSSSEIDWASTSEAFHKYLQSNKENIVVAAPMQAQLSGNVNNGSAKHTSASVKNITKQLTRPLEQWLVTASDKLEQFSMSGDKHAHLLDDFARLTLTTLEIVGEAKANRMDRLKLFEKLSDSYVGFNIGKLVSALNSFIETQEKTMFFGKQVFLKIFDGMIDEPKKCNETIPSRATFEKLSGFDKILPAFSAKFKKAQQQHGHGKTSAAIIASSAKTLLAKHGK